MSISVAAQLARDEKVLNTFIKYDTVGIMTRKKWLEMQFLRNSTVKQVVEKAIMFNRRKHYMMNYDQQREYEKRCEEEVIRYQLFVDVDMFYYITKTEYKYFNSLLKTTI